MIKIDMEKLEVFDKGSEKGKMFDKLQFESLATVDGNLIIGNDMFWLFLPNNQPLHQAQPFEYSDDFVDFLVEKGYRSDDIKIYEEDEIIINIILSREED